jgi:hypothetical protein
MEGMSQVDVEVVRQDSLKPSQALRQDFERRELHMFWRRDSKSEGVLTTCLRQPKSHPKKQRLPRDPEMTKRGKMDGI